MPEHYVPNLGNLPDESARRDAVHVAVAPVIACEDLSPGSHVGLMNGLATIDMEPIGVVDPFLQRMVKQGERFWLFLYPGTITSLRHVWSHPAFSPKLPS